VKIIEARFASKLHNYLETKNDRSQVGFVRKLGVQVNITRAFKRITLRSSQKKNVYGFFIDFGHAYNSIPNIIFFKHLLGSQFLE